MFGIGMPELLIIGFIVLVIFGAGKLPRVMGQMGKGIKDFKDSILTGSDDEKPTGEGKGGVIGDGSQ